MQGSSRDFGTSFNPPTVTEVRSPSFSAEDSCYYHRCFPGAAFGLPNVSQVEDG